MQVFLQQLFIVVSHGFLLSLVFTLGKLSMLRTIPKLVCLFNFYDSKANTAISRQTLGHLCNVCSNIVSHLFYKQRMTMP